MYFKFAFICLWFLISIFDPSIALFQDIELPRISEHFTDGQRVVFYVGCWIVLTTQITAVTFFFSTWIRGGYSNSGTGIQDKDSQLEAHETQALKRDVIIFLSLVAFLALVFTIPLLEKVNIYPLSVIWILGTGSFGGIILGLLERGKALFKGTKSVDMFGATDTKLE